MNYSLLTEEKLFRRFDSLPESLQTTLGTERTLIIVENICRGNHIVDEEKILIIQQLTALTLLGYIHVIDLGQKINNELGIANHQLTNSIAEEIGKKIFAPIKDALEQNYEPLPEELIARLPATLEEIRKPTTRFSEPGTGQAVPSPVSPLRGETSPIRKSEESKETFEEKPIILHEETEFEPGKPASGFKLETPPPKFDETGEKFMPPMRPARLEIGIEIKPPAQEPTPPRPPTEAPKVINYTDLRTPAPGLGETIEPRKPLMSPEQELPAPPTGRPTPIAPTRPSIATPPPPGGSTFGPRVPPSTGRAIGVPEPSLDEMSWGAPSQKKKRGFWAWLRALFGPRRKKEIVFAPRVISEEDLKRETLTIKASMPKPPPPAHGPRPSEPFRTPAPPAPPTGGPQPTQRPARGPSVFEEVVDLSTFTKTKKPFPPPEAPDTGSNNTVNLTPTI